MKIRIVFTGRSYDAADQFPQGIEVPDQATLDDVLDVVNQELGDQHLPESCLVVRSGQHLGTVAAHESAVLHDGDELMLIAPVAGG